MIDQYLPDGAAGMAAIGIDIGTRDLKAVGIDALGRIQWRFKSTHHGEPESALLHLEENTDLPSSRRGITGTIPLASQSQWFDSALCLATAVQKQLPGTTNILEVGASHYRLLCCGQNGDLFSIRTNPLCAAGTGSFLDGQAARMGLAFSEANDIPVETDPPAIATRCAVFAKSDLIHRQQEGYPVSALWSGLCRGVVDGIVSTLTKGQPLQGQTVLCGGVARNTTFVRWLQEKLADGQHHTRLVAPPEAEFMGALGAALLAANGSSRSGRLDIVADAPARGRRKPLRLSRSRFPKVRPLSATTDAEGNEITVYRPLEGRIRCFLGIDIGSTSTKLALVDERQEILMDIYRRTDSDPIGATRHLFEAVLATTAGRWEPWVVGVGTTGSGRKMIGQIVGADLIINEISAHVAGAVRFDPEVETIFEIGGQDAKYMRVHRGRIVDANMNYVCAAGTGSFLDELAAKLGYRIEDLGEAALGIRPPYTSTRCTVFMEQDVHRLMREGLSAQEAAGAVIYSVIENYLDRVVGKRPVSTRRISFQGATARNRALVAAVENILDVEVVISPYPHVMGAYGAALKAMQNGRRAESRFKGFDLASRKITVLRETCTLCRNRCTLSRAEIQGQRERPVWGMKCGRDENEKQRREPPGFRLYDLRQKAVLRDPALPTPKTDTPRVILPRALSSYSMGPFWRRFFHELGIQAVVGPATREETVARGRRFAGAEFCLPLKVAYGHVSHLLARHPDDVVFFPHLIADYEVDGLTQTRFCPYLEVLPSMIRSNPTMESYQQRIIAPVIDLRLSDRKNADQLAEALAPFARRSRRAIRRALKAAHAERQRLEREMLERGRTRLHEILGGKKPAVVIIGRPYNTLDNVVSHKIPYEIAASGIEVLPMEALPWKPELLQGEFANLFWAYGQKIVSALMQVAATRGLYAVYLSNFGCGPDSFILSYAETIMGEKPFLILELDEHGSSGGYQTRLEAFLDVVASDWRHKASYNDRRSPPAEPPAPGNLKQRRLLIPHMHPVGGNLLAAAIRSAGFNAVALPVEDNTCFALGKKWTRGSECLPTPLTLGSFLYHIEQMRASGRDPRNECAVFMPTSDGPCRFGQYRTLTRIVLDTLGYGEVPIVSPSSENAYYDLDKEIFQYVLISDILYKMRCRTKPYEKTDGDTLAALDTLTARAEKRIEAGRMDAVAFLKQAGETFQKIPVVKDRRPLVGIVGEIYVRCNGYANAGLVDTIENLGGEAWLSPVSEWIMYAAWIERHRLRRRGIGLKERARLDLRWNFMVRKEHRLYAAAGNPVKNRREPPVDRIVAQGARFMPVDFEGESVLTVGRALLFRADGADLVVNCAPFGCMHGNITSAIFDQQREKIGIPVVNIMYDGHEGNDPLQTFIQVAQHKLDRQGGRPLE